MKKDVRTIVGEYLERVGADGLAGDDCGCGKDDLFPCELDPSQCVAAIWVERKKREGYYKPMSIKKEEK